MGFGLARAWRTFSCYENFAAPDYHVMNHITLQLDDGTTQIDHILTPRFYAFFIDTKDCSGWIVANQNRSHWTLCLFRSKFGFRNLVLQKKWYVRTVLRLLTNKNDAT